jgi:hypothetical protein
MDHPLLRFSLRGAAEDLDAILREVAVQSGSVVYSTDRRYSDGAGQPVVAKAWTILNPVSTDEDERAQFSKLRVYLSRSGHEIVVTPISPTTESLAGLIERISRLHPALKKAWALPDRRELPSSADADLPRVRRQAEVTWANYLIESHLLRPYVDRLTTRLGQTDLLAHAAPQVDPFDIALLVGREATHGVVGLLDAFWRDSSSPFQMPLPASVTRSLDLDGNLPARFLPDYKALVKHIVRRAQSDAEIVSLVLLAQRREIEERSRTAEGGVSQRLEFGVPFRYLEEILKGAHRGRLDYVSAHRALDAAIDTGLAVPKYLSQRGTVGEIWYRGFRVGEAPHVLGAAVLEAVESLAVALGTTDLPEVVTEKYVVLLFSHLRLLDAPELSNTLPVVREWYRYGARMAVIDGPSHTPLLPWAVRFGILERRLVNGDPKYGISSKGASLLSRRILEPPARAMVTAVARWVADARERKGLGVRFLRLVSGSESEDAYCHALEAELDGWLTGHPSIDHAIGALQTIDSARARGREIPDHAWRILEGNANWSSQAIDDKMKSFAERTRLLTAARRAWPPRGEELDRRETWNEILLPRVDLDRPARYGARQVLEDASRLMRAITTLVRNVADEWAGVDHPKRLPIDQSAQELIEATRACGWRLSCGLRPNEGLLGSLVPEMTHERLTADLGAVVASYSQLLGWALRWTRGTVDTVPESVTLARHRELRQEILRLATTVDRSAAGMALNDWLFDLCDRFGLQPIAHYTLPGQEIDGAITIGGQTYILEAKWLDRPATTDDLRDFMNKIQSKPPTTKGIFVSMSGYQKDAAENLLRGQQARFVMLDGGHVATVTNTTRDLADLITRAYEHFERTTVPYVPSHAASSGVLIDRERFLRIL